MLIATDATGTVTSPDSIATLLPSDLPAVTSLTSGVNAISASVQTALTNNYLRKTSGNVVNADISGAAAIAYSKLNLTGNIVNADINAAAAIAKTKLASLAVVNADVAAGAAITFDKFAAQPYCLAYRSKASAAQSFAAASGFLSFSAASQTGSMWAGGNPTRLTVPLAGQYVVTVSCACTGSSIGVNDTWRVVKNGAVVLATKPADGSSISIYTGEVGVFTLAASDYIEIQWLRTASTGISTFAMDGGTLPAPALAPVNEGISHFGAARLVYLGV